MLLEPFRKITAGSQLKIEKCSQPKSSLGSKINKTSDIILRNPLTELIITPHGLILYETSSSTRNKQGSNGTVAYGLGTSQVSAFLRGHITLIKALFQFSKESMSLF